MGRMNLDLAINDLVEELSENNIEEAEIIEETFNNEDKKKKWQPKEWRVEYERVVVMDLMGMKGYEIAEKTGYTPQHVYNILGTDEAIAIQKAMIGRVRKETFSITDEIREIQELTVKRLKSCLKDDDTFKESKLGFISKGLDVMKGVGDYLKNAPTTQVNNNTVVLPPSIADRFMVGLEKSDEARRLLVERNSREVGVVEAE